MKGPLKKFRAGSVSCALWENEAVVNGRDVTMLEATIEHRCRDKGGIARSALPTPATRSARVEQAEQRILGVLCWGTQSPAAEPERVQVGNVSRGEGAAFAEVIDVVR